MVFAAFAVGRSQQLIYLLHVLMEHGRIPQIPIYLDSPMAIHAENIYAQFLDEHDLSKAQLLGVQQILNGPGVHLTRSADESKQINNVAGPAVIIASSGMMTGGRILHHLEQRLPHEQNTVVLAGFMAQGTRGRALAQGGKVPAHLRPRCAGARCCHLDVGVKRPCRAPRIDPLAGAAPAAATSIHYPWRTRFGDRPGERIARRSRLEYDGA